MATAAKSRIAPGESSIDRAKVRKKDGSFWIDWRIRMPDGTLFRKRSKGQTIGEARRNAKATAKEMLLTDGHGEWKSTDLINDYIRQVSIPAIKSSNLRPHTKMRYSAVIKLILQEYKPPEDTTGYTIASGTNFKTLERIIRKVAKEHGKESAHHTRTVLSKYVLQNLIRDGLIEHNPLLKETIDLGLPVDEDDDNPQRGGRALTLEQYTKVAEKLLSIVPEEGISKPKQGRFGLEDRVAKRRNTIDITLLQAATGLRVGEANAITWKDVTFTDDGQASIHISKALSKTHKMRDVPILNPKVIERLKTRKQSARNDTDHVIGSPTDASKIWDPRNCSKAIASLYNELADDLDIDLLHTARAHVWRATLNTILDQSVPEILRAAYFGHTRDVNRESYTDTTNVTPMVGAFKALYDSLL